MGTEAGRTALVEAIDEWLPILSDWLLYSRKTYPVIVHRIPTTFDTSRDSADVCEHLIDYNSDIFACPSTLLSAEFLGGKCNRTSQKARGSLILHIADPMTANTCIDRCIAFEGSLLPTAKFVRCPPRCFNCHQTGHFARSCQAESRCGLCTGAHNTKECGKSRVDSPDGHPAPLKCAACGGPHAASDDSCAAHRAAIGRHWVKTARTGPFYQTPG